MIYRARLLLWVFAFALQLAKAYPESVPQRHWPPGSSVNGELRVPNAALSCAMLLCLHVRHYILVLLTY